MATKNIKAMTMVRNDRFLCKWVEYYGRELGHSNLYVVFDGEDQAIPEYCKGVNTIKIPKMQGNVSATDYARSRYMSGLAATLMRYGAEMVIATDADEFLVCDPATGMSLREFLSSLPDRPCYSGLGVDVLQYLPDEAPVDFGRPFLSQRSRGWLYSRYTKPSVITRPLTWGGGYHRVKGKNYHIAKDLYLFHFGGVDRECLREISADESRSADGWARHQQKRQRAIERISRVKARRWDTSVRVARLMQTVCRPLFALNKPTTYGLKMVAEIPQRFRDTV